MDFDPDKYLQEKTANAGTAQGFDPDRYLSEKTGEQKPADWAGRAKAGVDHFANSASLGYLPQIRATVDPHIQRLFDSEAHPLQRLQSMLTLSLPSEFIGEAAKHIISPDADYLKNRDSVVKDLDTDTKEHPGWAMGGKVAGALTSGALAAEALPLQAAKAGMLGKLATQAAKPGLAGLGGRALQSGVSGAALGAVANPGDVEGQANSLQLGDRAADAALTGATATFLHPVAEGMSAGVGALAGGAKNLAYKAAAKALGPYQRDVRVNGLDGMKDVGKEALDQNVISWMPKSWEKMAGVAKVAKNQIGQEIEKLVDELGQSQAASGVPGVNRSDIADALRKRLIQPASGNPTIRSQNEVFSNLIDEFEHSGTPVVNLPGLRELKEGARKQVNWDRLPGTDIPNAEQFNRSLVGEMKGAEEKAAQEIGAAQGRGADQQLVGLKKSYGNMAEGSDMAQTRAEKEAANRFLGLTDYVSGATGAGIGAYVGNQIDPHEGWKTGAEVGGALGGLGNKMMRQYGNQVVAKSANAIGNGLAKMPKLFDYYNKNPQAFASYLQNVLRKNGKPEMKEEDREPAATANSQPLIQKEEAQTRFVQGSNSGRSTQADVQ